MTPLWKWGGYFRYYSKRKGLEAVIDKFEPDADKARRRELRRKMRKAMVKYYWDFDEFFLFGYEHTTHKERLQYVPEYEKNVFCDKVNNGAAADVFYDKWETYCHFNAFFNRDVAYIHNLNDIDKAEVDTFLQKHHSYIAKPTSQACGRGIEIIHTKDSQEAKAKLSDYCSKGALPCIIEELISQDGRMAAFHPSSVNTVRIPTFRFDDETVVLQPFMRIGQGDAIVDNAGHGGIICNLDVDTGRVYSCCDERGRRFTSHPDTGKEIIGFQVPCWEEAKSMVKALADVLPAVRYVGWDLALTLNGWVLVEGNDKGQFVFQYPASEGFRPTLMSILQRYNDKR